MCMIQSEIFAFGKVTKCCNVLMVKFIGAEFRRFLSLVCQRVILNFALFCVEMLTQFILL